ncbi:hypothetical protein NEIRO03_1717 [Nematocida sp. AWRm78]|nr:hypothetical protein NEIRO02_1754 [Nematocida sp. AWRm79]KAI5184440.1 hypothetical protein NEIRO03_1717 [Nematocida sp. AWRm78]
MNVLLVIILYAAHISGYYYTEGWRGSRYHPLGPYAHPYHSLEYLRQHGGLHAYSSAYLTPYGTPYGHIYHSSYHNARRHAAYGSRAYGACGGAYAAGASDTASAAAAAASGYSRYSRVAAGLSSGLCDDTPYGY